MYVESSLDHYLELAESVARSAVSCLQDGAVVTAANVAAARALVDRFETLCTRIVVPFAESPTIREDGYRNVSEWLAYNTHARPTEGEQRVAHAQVYAKLPGWSDAIDAGTVGVSHVSVVAKVLTKARLPLLERDAADMLGWAQTFTFTKFRQAVAMWVSRSDDALGDPTLEKEHEEARRVQLSPTSGGMWILNGLLDTLGGEALSKALEAAMPKPCEATIGLRRSVVMTHSLISRTSRWRTKAACTSVGNVHTSRSRSMQSRESRTHRKWCVCRRSHETCSCVTA